MGHFRVGDVVSKRVGLNRVEVESDQVEVILNHLSGGLLVRGSCG